jgi:hypothetical protein
VYAHKQIIDLSAGEEFTFTCPYTSSYPYYSVDLAYGMLVFYVEGALNYPATVANTVHVDVEAAAAPGFELACPRPSPWSPVTMVGAALPPPKDGKSHFCAGYGEMMLSDDKLLTIGAAKSSDQGVELAKDVIGERILSLRQLMSVHTVVATNPFFGTTPISFRPYSCGITYARSTGVGTSAWTNPDMSLDYYSKFLPMFLFSRGSVSFSYWGFSSASVALSGVRAYFVHNTTQTLTMANDTTNDRACRRMVYASRNGGAEEFAWTVPQTQQCWARLNRPSATNATTVIFNEPLDAFSSQAAVIMTANVNEVNGIPHFLRRGINDDFQAGFFIGCPLFTNLSSISPNGLEGLEPAPTQVPQVHSDGLSNKGRTFGAVHLDPARQL